ncbi:MAG: TIGR04282 family arsenosugar biosynthesis glycosyltransferase [Akkermansiaceae bacterium]
MPFSPTVLLFLKAPRPGFVKTRLAKELGEQTACKVYRQLAEMTLATIPTNWQKIVFFAPADARQEMQQWLGYQVELRPQSEGDLGDRLSTACSETFAEGADSVFLLGGDCPYIEPKHLKEAADQLARGHPVIGPAIDGGYWSLGLSKETSSVFKNISWSSDKVFSETLQRFSVHGEHPHQLESLEDVDRADAWSRALKNVPDLSKFPL